MRRYNIKSKGVAIISSILILLSLSACSVKDIDAQTSTGNNSTKETNSVVTSNESELHFIDTGNSDAILIKNNNKFALIDGGDNDDEEERVVSYLKDQGVKELEHIFATHPHADHIGGLDAVVNDIPVKNVYVSNGDSDSKTYSDFIYAMANKGLSPSVPLLNSEFKLGSGKFKVISAANEKDPNNNSLVLEYVNGNDKVLLMGDAEEKIERELDVSDVDLLKVGHHGSRSSSSSSFIDKINPKYAVILVGANNKYGHPHKETMDTLASKNIEIHRSDECGHIVFKSSGNGLSVDCKVSTYTPSINTNTNSEDTNIKPDKNSTTTTVVEDKTKEDIVYWTPNGKSYHSTKSCPTLSRSKTINSGTQAESGKYDPCDRCISN